MSHLFLQRCHKKVGLDQSIYPFWHAKYLNWIKTDRLDRQTGQTDWTDRLDRQTAQTDWTDRLDRQTGQTDWTDSLNRQTGHSDWTDRLDRSHTSQLFFKD